MYLRNLHHCYCYLIYPSFFCKHEDRLITKGDLIRNPPLKTLSNEVRQSTCVYSIPTPLLSYSSPSNFCKHEDWLVTNGHLIRKRVRWRDIVLPGDEPGHIIHCLVIMLHMQGQTSIVIIDFAAALNNSVSCPLVLSPPPPSLGS